MELYNEYMLLDYSYRSLVKLLSPQRLWRRETPVVSKNRVRQSTKVFPFQVLLQGISVFILDICENAKKLKIDAFLLCKDNAASGQGC